MPVTTLYLDVGKIIPMEKPSPHGGVTYPVGLAKLCKIVKYVALDRTETEK